jgi:2',3'-cyclic-nucleotide 2'-phosphodiesterase (5'-nucleotidase family)
MKSNTQRFKQLGLVVFAVALLCAMLPIHSLADTPRAKSVFSAEETWELRILHTSDQEAGKKALLDISGIVAVMDELDKLPYPNTLKLTSGDLFIAGPFMNASQVLYSNPSRYTKLKPHQRTMEPLAMLPGIADMIINNSLGWQAAVIGNHEFDGISQRNGVLNEGNFFELISADSKIKNYDGRGIGKDAKDYIHAGAGIGSAGYPGAQFPYLSVNLDFNSFKAKQQGESIFKAYGLKDSTSRPRQGAANTLARSTVIPVGNSKVGVIGATTPFLPDIVGGLDPTNLLAGTYRSKESSAAEQAAVLRPLIQKEVAALEREGIDKIVLLTHLQDSAIEEVLSQQLVDQGIGVDVVIGGGSHKLMGPADGSSRGMLRGLDQSSVIDPAAKAEQKVKPALVPYPIALSNSTNSSRILYVNGGSNYEYLNQLIVRFDRQGRVVGHDEANSRPWRTDGAGVSMMLNKPQWVKLSANEQNQRIKEHLLGTSPNPQYRNAIQTLNAVDRYINGLDSIQYGFSGVWLNGANADVRSRETNLGNLVADSLLWYGQQLHHNNPSLKAIKSIDVAFVNGGGIRDMIGTEQVMPDETVHRSPPEANPSLDKQVGEISKLDVLNSLRFDNTITMGSISIDQLKRSVEAMVSESRHGGFGQISGFRFRYDPNRPRGNRVIDMDLTKPILLSDGRVDGRSQQQEVVRPLVRDGKALNPDEQLGLVTITYLAEGGDGQGGAQLTQHMRNVYWIGVAGDAPLWRSLGLPNPSLFTQDRAPNSVVAGVEKRQLGFGSYRDALGAYLEANHGSGGSPNPLIAADSLSDPSARPKRILRADSQGNATRNP